MISTSRLEAIRNRHLGERVVLVANGPSLNNMDLSFLQREIFFGMNKIFLGFNQFKFYPRYYVAVNKKVIEQSENQIKALNCFKFINLRDKDSVTENALTYHINTWNPPEQFCHDISHGVHEGWTVTYTALQIIYYLGFREVVIIDMNHRFEYSGEPNEARIMYGSDPNHFSPDYFGNGQTWDNPDLARSEESYRLARSKYEKNGRRIIDATADGACTVFEKTDYRQFFGMNK